MMMNPLAKSIEEMFGKLYRPDRRACGSADMKAAVAERMRRDSVRDTKEHR
jgi:hypothetical protein